MKLCAVYKSSRKADTYLYVPEKDDFSQVPSALLKAIGTPIFVMLIPVQKREQIAHIDKQTFIDKINHDGFYLQLPPKPESMLESHRQQMGLKP